MVVIIFIAFIVMCISVDALVQYSRKKSKVPEVSEVSSVIFNESSVSVPGGLYFDKTHTWAFMEKNGDVKIGIDDFLLHITGSLSRVKMKNNGEKLQKGEPAITIIQSGKQLTINAPVSGTVKFKNNQLTEDCTLVNSSPYYNGWVYTIVPSDWLSDIRLLIMAEKYKEWLKNEFTRLKDFLSVVKLKSNAESARIMLQDGGELKVNVLADMGPEVWEEFQAKFINTSG